MLLLIAALEEDHQEGADEEGRGDNRHTEEQDVQIEQLIRETQHNCGHATENPDQEEVTTLLLAAQEGRELGPDARPEQQQHGQDGGKLDDDGIHIVELVGRQTERGLRDNQVTRR